MTQTIRVRVRLFAVLAELAGTRELEVDLPVGSTIADAAAALEQRFPQLAPWTGRVSYARNHEYASPEDQLATGDELALLPPVSGGGDAGGIVAASADGRFVVTQAPLSVDRVVALAAHRRAGAVCAFTGTVREFTGNRQTRYLEYDAYGEMAVKEMQRLEAEIRSRWPGSNVAIHHRVGRLEVGEISVVIAVATPHRHEAFAACRYGIDELKRRVPIWKKEVYADGSRWVGRDGSGPWSTP